MYYLCFDREPAMPDQMTGTTKGQGVISFLLIIELSIDSIVASDLYRHVIITLKYAKQVYRSSEIIRC